MQLLRIAAEEMVLGEDAAHRAYAGAAPFRLLPGVYQFAAGQLHLVWDASRLAPRPM